MSVPPLSLSLPRFIAHLKRSAERHVVDAGGTRVCWRRFGDGEPLVLLHGGHGSWLHWVRNIEALASRFSLWLPDMPGYGDSDTPAEPTLESLLEPLHASLDTLLGAGARIALGGFSFGGLVAAQLAARRGAIGRLMLLGPAGHGQGLRRRTELVGWRDAPDAEELARRMRHNLGAHMLHADDAIDALALHAHTVSCVRTRFRSREISHAGGLSQALDGCNAPVLLIWGEHDMSGDPARLAPLLTAAHPSRQARILPDAGHWVQYEQADAVNRLLCEWR